MKTKLCPNCHKPNVAGALACVYCGAFFNVGTTRTVSLPEGLVGVSRLEHVEHLMRMHRHSLVMFPAHAEKPIIVDDSQHEIVIGRHAEVGAKPSVDLEDYGAAKLGLSRRHACIRRSTSGCTIEDMESKNGTWLNGARLEPNVAHVLRSGDEVRLGHLIIHVYFEMPGLVSKTVFFINTQHDTGTVNRHRLPAYDLATGLSPFLRAMGDAQSIIDTLQGVTQSDIGVTAISTDKQSRTISVVLDGGSAIIALISGHVMPWKHDNRPLIEAKGDDLRREMYKLAFRMLTQVKPGIDEQDAKQYIQQLLPILQTFVFSIFEMTLEQPILEH